jgi:putative transposase
LVNCAGCARFAYNWALSQWNEHWAFQKKLPQSERKYISEQDLRKRLNAIKRTDYPFLMDVTKYAPQEAIKQLGTAFKNFFKGKARYPKYRKRYVDDRFTIGNDQVQVKGKKVRFPHIGWIKMREAIRFAGKVKTVSISREADRWFISFCVEVDDHTCYFKQHAENQGEVTAVDVGAEVLATLSNGEKFENPKPLRKNLKKLKQLQKALARKKKGSKNRQRAKMRIAKLHRRISNIRKDAMHKMTSSIADRFRMICVENLNVKGMMKNRRLALSLADASFYEAKRQLTYKAKLRGGVVIEAPRFFASSKLCSCCNQKNEQLKLSDRSWVCQSCGTEHDRDINAAVNLRQYAVSYTVKASGEVSSGLVNPLTVANDGKGHKVKLTSVKDETNLLNLS